MRKRTLILVTALVIFGIGLTVFRIFFLRMVGVPSSSMANTIIPGDHLFIIKSFAQPERGTIIIFQYDPEIGGKGDRYLGDTQYYIARVVGLPGETIQIRGRTIYINGKALEEQKVMVRESQRLEPLQPVSTEGNGPYSVFYSRTSEEESAFYDLTPFASESPFQIPKEQYFVMGDNRDDSADSRYRGAVPKNLIWGKVALVFYSTTMDTNEIRWERMFKRIR